MNVRLANDEFLDGAYLLTKDSYEVGALREVGDVELFHTAFVALDGFAQHDAAAHVNHIDSEGAADAVQSDGGAAGGWVGVDVEAEVAVDIVDAGRTWIFSSVGGEADFGAPVAIGVVFAYGADAYGVVGAFGKTFNGVWRSGYGELNGLFAAGHLDLILRSGACPADGGGGFGDVAYGNSCGNVACNHYWSYACQGDGVDTNAVGIEKTTKEGELECGANFR